MLAAKFSKTAASWLGASVKAPKTSVARKVNLKSTFVKKTKKISIPVFTKIEVRSVITLAEGVAVEENDVTHVADLRGLDQSVEFITGVPQSQLHRRVIIYRPTPKTTQSGTKNTNVYMRFARQGNRVNENLMGWTATTDPTGNLTLSFSDDNAAIAFAQRNGLEYELITPEGQDRIREPKDYAYNFRFRDPKKQHNDNFDF